MLFSSFTFIFLFLPVLLLIYYLSKDKYKNNILLLFSLGFYAWGEPKFLIYMVGSIIFNYIFAILMDKYKKLKKIIFIISMCFNIGLLVYFKYTDFLIESFNSLTNSNFDLLNIMLPLGISFYTFQVLSYIIDVYNNKTKLQKNILTLATYIALFPQLIAGPIVRYQTVEKELNKRKVSLDLFIDGIKRFIIGLARKVIIANNVAVIADLILSESILGLNGGFVISIVGILAYTIQIYFDFSGYSEMAIGLGKMFGFNFLENFNYPYIATSITDFWRRWHISLSTWFRDYVYIPLGGNRVSKFRWCINILIVWGLTGLWHGASINFIVWGVYFGVVLLLEKMFLLKFLSKLPNVIRWIYSFSLIVLGWVIFRLESVELIKMFFSQSSFINEQTKIVLASNYYVLNYIPYLILGFILSFPILKKIKLPIIIEYSLYLIIFGISIAFLLYNTYNPFIYFRF